MDTGIANFLLATSAAQVAGQAWAASAALRERYEGNQEAFVCDAIKAAGVSAASMTGGPADQPELRTMAQLAEVRA